MRDAPEELDDVRQRRRRNRVAALEKLIQLSKGQDLDAELHRIRQERDADGAAGVSRAARP